MDIETIKEIEKYSDDEFKRIKFSLTLNEILCPLVCVLANVNPIVYYKMFKTVNNGKVRRLKELELNFKNYQMHLF